MVALSESEPYGVRGGSLVVLFAPAPNSKDTPVKVRFSDPFFLYFLMLLWIILLSPQIGHFPMDPSTVATFELHLTIQVLYHSFSSDLKFSQASMAVTTRVRQTLTNIVRKIGGKPTQVSNLTHPVFSLSCCISYLAHLRFILTPSSS